MILSHKHRFVFIKGIKVAGTSTEIALSQVCGPDDVITPITPSDERYRLGTAGEPRNYSTDKEQERAFLKSVEHASPAELANIRLPRSPCTNHMSLRDLLSIYPEAAEYELLFVERSPFAKVISYAHWEANQKAYKGGTPLPREASDLKSLVQNTLDSGTYLKVFNLPRYLGPDGRLRASGWRFETLQSDLNSFLRARGLHPATLVHAKAGLASERLAYDSLLSPSQLRTIEDHFAEEFEQFGYRVVTAAMSNPGQ